MMAPVYGLAEQAANILRAQYSGVPLAPPPKSGSGNGTGSGSGSGTKSGGNPEETGTGNQNAASIAKPAALLVTLIAAAVALL